MAAAIPPTLVSNLWCVCNLLRQNLTKILSKSDPGLSQIPPKSFQNRSKSDFKRLQGLFGHYFRSHIEKSSILYAKMVVLRRPRVPGRSQNYRKIGSNFQNFPNFFSMWFSMWFRSHFACSGARKSCSRLGETLVFPKSWVSKKVSEIIDFQAIFG